jgi:hypothetical protein
MDPAAILTYQVCLSAAMWIVALVWMRKRESTAKWFDMGRFDNGAAYYGTKLLTTVGAPLVLPYLLGCRLSYHNDKFFDKRRLKFLKRVEKRVAHEGGLTGKQQDAKRASERALGQDRASYYRKLESQSDHEIVPYIMGIVTLAAIFVPLWLVDWNTALSADYGIMEWGTGVLNSVGETLVNYGK